MSPRAMQKAASREERSAAVQEPRFRIQAGRHMFMSGAALRRQFSIWAKTPAKRAAGSPQPERRSTRRDRKASSPVFQVGALRHWRWRWSRKTVWKESQCLRRARLLNRPWCFQMVQLQWCHSCRERPYWLRPSIAWYHDRSTQPSKFLVRLRMYRQLTMRR